MNIKEATIDCFLNFGLWGFYSTSVEKDPNSLAVSSSILIIPFIISILKKALGDFTYTRKQWIVFFIWGVFFFILGSSSISMVFGNYTTPKLGVGILAMETTSSTIVYCFLSTVLYPIIDFFGN